MGIIDIHKDRINIKQDYILGTIDTPQNVTNRRNPIAYLITLSKSKDKDPIINGRDIKNAKNGDIVIGKIVGGQRGRKKVKVIYVTNNVKADEIGVTINENGKIYIKEFFSKNTIPTNSKQKALKSLPDDVVLTVDSQTREIKEIIGVLADPKIDEKVVLKRYKRYEDFPKKAIEEASSWGDEVFKDLYPNRLDLTHLPFITIDPVTAKDYDDAIYFDKIKNTLYVAIADVTEYVREFSQLDSEAKKRGFTIYFPHKSIPMLPRSLSENLCSLNEGVDRLTFIFKIDLTKDAKVDKFELFEGVIRSQRRFTYEEIDILLDNPAKATQREKGFLDFLLPLKELVHRLREKRLANGYTFRTPDIKIELDKDLKFSRSIQEDETLSHQLIEECMLLANISASTYFDYGIYRSHPEPDSTSIERLMGDLISVGIYPKKTEELHKKILDIQIQADNLHIREMVDKMIIRSMKRAEYTYENSGHFGLGFERYTHFTSPIRRYSDLILHRFLKSIIANDKKKEKYINSSLAFTTKIVTTLESETTKIAWDYEDLIYTRWAKENINNEFEAVVTDLGERGRDTIVKLQEKAFGARVFCRISRGVQVANFSTVIIKIIKADLIGVKVYGEITGLNRSS